MTRRTARRPPLWIPLLLVPVATALATACDAAPATAPAKLPTADLTIGSKTYHAEVAADEASREHGLMDRDAVPADGGMIFVFADDQVRGFWMKNTRVDLDILFLDADGKVVSIRSMKAYDDQHTTSSGVAAEYAVELAAGQVKACGVKVGDKIPLPKEVGAAKE